MRKQITQNQFWMALILAFFVLAFSGQDISAQKKKKPKPNNKAIASTASIEETLEWLKPKFENYGKLSNYSLELTQIDGCKIKYIEKGALVGDVVIDTTVPLGDIDPFTIKTEPYIDENGVFQFVSLSFHTFNNKKTIRNLMSPSDGTDEWIEGNTIRFNDESMAKRIARAIKHAVTLCGGKVEPF